MAVVILKGKLTLNQLFIISVKTSVADAAIWGPGANSNKGPCAAAVLTNLCHVIVKKEKETNTLNEGNKTVHYAVVSVEKENCQDWHFLHFFLLFWPVSYKY